ncbi:MAG: RIP metalloprotease RseP [Bdellovibrionaceae bacterium]|nr:RIP metalloprotease RseP [Pseudobdellovibrionaceae bacterium]
MLSFLGFLAILCPLVIVHEFGHFFFAKLFNVKAEAFSVGFGPRLFKKQIGETEFRLSIIPLGGYVKLLGEDPEVEMSEEDRKRALHNQVPWKRFFIFFGGPLFNFLFAIVIFMAILVIGEPKMMNVIGRVIDGSPAQVAGIQSGDRVVNVNGVETPLYVDFLNQISEYPGKTVSLGINREGSASPITLKAPVSEQPGFSVYGEPKRIGVIEGVYPVSLSSEVGVSSPESWAAQNGIQTGWKILAINGISVQSWESVKARYHSVLMGGKVDFFFETKEGEQRHIVASRGKDTIEKDLGIYSTELFIKEVVPESPAQAAGLLAGDRIVKIGTQSLNSFFDLKKEIQRQSENKKEVLVTWESQGKIKSGKIVPTETIEKDPNLKKIKTFTIGVLPIMALAPPMTTIQRVWNPFKLLYLGTKRMAIFTWRNVVTIGKMFSGDVSVKTLGGPILIGKVAGESINRGLIAFLTTMAVLSVGLGFLNILPVPVLDGGHLLLLGVEMIRGKPLSMKQMELAQQVGLVAILTLMVVVMKNDLSRLSIFN